MSQWQCLLTQLCVIGYNELMMQSHEKAVLREVEPVEFYRSVEMPYTKKVMLLYTFFLAQLIGVAFVFVFHKAWTPIALIAACAGCFWCFQALKRQYDAHEAKYKHKVVRITPSYIEVGNGVNRRQFLWPNIERIEFHHGFRGLELITINRPNQKHFARIEHFADMSAIAKEVSGFADESTHVLQFGGGCFAPISMYFVFIGLLLVDFWSVLPWIDFPKYAMLISLLFIVWPIRSWWRFKESPRTELTAKYKILSRLLLVGVIGFNGYFFWQAGQDNICNIFHPARLWRSCLDKYDGDHFVLNNLDEPLLAVADYDELTIRPIGFNFWQSKQQLDVESYPSILGYSPSGKYLSAATSDSEITRWDTATWAEVNKFPIPSEDSLLSDYGGKRMVWLDDEHYLREVDDAHIAVFNIETQQQTSDVIAGRVWSAAVDGRSFVVGPLNPRLEELEWEVVSVENGQIASIEEIAIEYHLMWSYITMSPDGSKVAGCTKDGISLYDRDSREVLDVETEFMLGCSMAFSADNNSLYVVAKRACLPRSLECMRKRFTFSISDELVLKKEVEYPGKDLMRNPSMMVSADNRYIIFSDDQDTFIFSNIFEK